MRPILLIAILILPVSAFSQNNDINGLALDINRATLNLEPGNNPSINQNVIETATENIQVADRLTDEVTPPCPPESSNSSSKDQKGNEQGEEVIFQLRYLPLSNEQTNPRSDQEFQFITPSVSSVFRLYMRYDVDPSYNKFFVYKDELTNLLKKPEQTLADYQELVTKVIDSSNNTMKIPTEDRNALIEGMTYQLIGLDLLFSNESDRKTKLARLGDANPDLVPKMLYSMIETLNGNSKLYQTKHYTPYNGQLKTDIIFNGVLESLIKNNSLDALEKMMTSAANYEKQYNEFLKDQVQYFTTFMKSLIGTEDSPYRSYLVFNNLQVKNEMNQILPNINFVLENKKTGQIYEVDPIGAQKNANRTKISSRYIFDLDGRPLANLPSKVSTYIDQLFPVDRTNNTLFSDATAYGSDASIGWQKWNSAKGNYLGIKVAMWDDPTGEKNFIVAVNHQMKKEMIQNPTGFVRSLKVALATTLGTRLGEPGEEQNIFIYLKHQNALVLTLLDSQYISFGGLVGTEIQLDGQFQEKNTIAVGGAVRGNEQVFVDVKGEKLKASVSAGAQQYVAPSVNVEQVMNDLYVNPNGELPVKVGVASNGLKVETKLSYQANKNSQIFMSGRFIHSNVGNGLMLSAGTKFKAGPGSLNMTAGYSQTMNENGVNALKMVYPLEGAFVSANYSIPMRRLRADVGIMLSEPFVGGSVGIQLINLKKHKSAPRPR